MARLFTTLERNVVREKVLDLARHDERVVGGAVVGSMAYGNGDRWSDLDLAFAVSNGFSVGEVIDDWTRVLDEAFGAVPLFDLPAGLIIYRVFLVPGCLQVDLSFAPEEAFGADGPKFHLLFGQAVEKAHVEPPSAETLFGYAAHHAVRARFSLERGRYWQAEYWLSGVRDYALSLACRRRGLPVSYGRGFDDLPDESRKFFARAFVVSLDRAEILRALDHAVHGLLREADGIDIARRVESDLLALPGPFDG